MQREGDESRWRSRGQAEVEEEAVEEVVGSMEGMEEAEGWRQKIREFAEGWRQRIMVWRRRWENLSTKEGDILKERIRVIDRKEIR